MRAKKIQVFEHNAQLYEGHYFLEVLSEHLVLLENDFWEITDHAENFEAVGEGFSCWRFKGISPALKAIMRFQELEHKGTRIDYMLKGENNTLFMAYCDPDGPFFSRQKFTE